MYLRRSLHMIKKFAVTGIVGVALGMALVHYLYPRIESRVEYRDRVKVETKVITRIKVVKSPDGSTTTDTEIIDTGSSTRDTSLVALKLAQKQYIVGAGAGFAWGRFEQPEYNLTFGRRIVGPVLGAITVSKERVSLGVLYEF
jgi:hypothetical protein